MPPAGETRIASLVPSPTELVCALGLGAQLVGRTGFCVHPADELRGIPKLGGTKDVRLEQLRALRPTHLLLNVDENRLDTAQAVEAWPESERPTLIVTHPGGPEDVPALVQQLVDCFGDDPGVPATVRATLADRAGRLQADLGAALAATRPEAHAPCRVLYLIWREPWMTVARDTYLSRMLARVNWLTWPDVAGGAHGAARYPALRGDEPWLAQVERVLLSSEPYAFGAAHIAQAQALCPRARVALVDGEALSWYGPRTVDGLALLRRLADDGARLPRAA